MALAATVPDAIHLEVGEPSFNTPEVIIRTAFQDALDGHTKYTPNAGTTSLRQAIADRYASSRKRPTTVQNVFVATGAVGALASAILVVAEDGDEVLIPDPGWPNYLSLVQLAGARAVPYTLRPEAGYTPAISELERLFSKKTKAIVINSPANPTGAVFDAGRIRAIVELAGQHEAFVISDEVYEDLVFDGSHVSAGSFDADGGTIVISGCSKSYAMTGWRLGWAIADADLVELMAAIQEPLTSCPSSISQRAAEAALRGSQDIVATMRDAYRERRDLVCGLLDWTGLLAARPHGAFYAMVDLRDLGMPSSELARRLLEEERVATAPGSTFGPSAEGMVRISLAASAESLAEGCRRIIRFHAKHLSAAPALGGSARRTRGDA
jgi:aspartate/methionine/tyrosine aminotransferase